MTANASKLLVKPDFSNPVYIFISPESAKWEHLHFAAVKLTRGETWSFETSDCELALTILGGKCDVTSSAGNWEGIGSRENVFQGMPTALYLPRRTTFTVKAISDSLDFACGWAKTDKVYPPVLIRPEDVTVELRGGDNVSRQINKMLPAGFPCDRLVVVEVYTPSGNWSSYPPHKHDQRKLDEHGNLIEADLEEIYFYKIDKPKGYAYQRIYTDDRSLDELMLVSDSHAVLSPEGYHPVVAAPGFNAYYLNYLAGSDQSLASSDDPAYSWVKDTWKEMDKRLPLVSINMNK
ncbi:MAG: 5-deoxy-glucuronate isomerase [Chloroflexi bacterium HGW-Chloroflexi-4]|jgi:5-deoxy-glucuronate isomerase|nr:MAG: 5-deoxy-glucuronate isomerase [Chloroflexi bacterium HGW-Chloroflexi-4]